MGARKKGCTQAKTTEIFCTICVDFQCQFRVKAKDLPIFCKWYKSTLFLFSVGKKKYYYYLSENFNRNFRKNGKPSDKYLYRCSVAPWNFTLERHECHPSRLGGGAQRRGCHFKTLVCYSTRFSGKVLQMVNNPLFFLFKLVFRVRASFIYQWINARGSCFWLHLFFCCWNKWKHLIRGWCPILKRVENIDLSQNMFTIKPTKRQTIAITQEC